jgi:hypothetical protein
MRKLFLFLGIILLSVASSAQTLKLKLTNSQTNTNVNGSVINKGDEFEVVVSVDPNNNITTRALYFDFEYQNTAFELISVNHTGTMGNGGVLPYSSQISMDHSVYPGYSWLSTQQNSSTDGNVRYQYANYTYTNGGQKTILRVYLNWAISNTQYTMGQGELLKLKFRLKADAPGYTWDAIRMNFIAAFNQNGSWGSTIMEIPETSVIILDPIATSYVNANIELNTNLSSISPIKVAFVDTLTKSGPLFDVASNGKVNVDQSQLQANKVYRVMAMLNMDGMNSVYNAAVTVSDFTTAQAEFVSQNLNGTFKNQNIKTGVGYFAADINRNKTFDGGDVVKIFSQSVSVDELISLPQGYAAGSNGSMSVPTFLNTEFNNLDSQTWKQASPFVIFTTGNIGTNLPLNLKYLLWGDINRSHSSQAIDANNIIKINSLASTTPINTTTPISSISVSLNNTVVTSNNIEIPIAINTNGTKVSGLQFEFIYDQTKIKFEELASTLPNGWFVFGTPKEGKLKFGAVDRELKASVTGEIIPFKLKFSSLVNGLDITTQIKVSNIMDASDDKGNQLGITLNTLSIKLTGYNKFK